METETLQKWEEQGLSLIEAARSITINEQGTRKEAAEFTMNARRTIKLIEDEFKPDIKVAHDLHKSLLLRMNTLAQRFKVGKAIVDKEISRYYLEQERIRKENERVAREKADAERKAAEEAREKEFDEACKTKDYEKASDIIDEDIIAAEILEETIAPSPPVEKTTRTAAGTATVRKDIKIELVNKNDVVIAVFEGLLPDGLLTVDMSYAKKYAKLNKLSTMPGFNITEIGVVSGRL